MKCKLVILSLLQLFFAELCLSSQKSSDLQECSDFYSTADRKSQEALITMHKKCTDIFMTFKPSYLVTRNITQEENLYINSLFRKLSVETSNYSGQKDHVHKRSIYNGRHRREVRAAPYVYWVRFATAVRRLKFDLSGGEGRSRYDTIADIHGLAMNQAHDGPNFLPWHRLYLLLFETALGVPLLYWDSSIDQEMIDPTKSILWTSKYFGNGFGEIETGPFAGFQTPAGSLFRNIGSDGILFDKRLIPNIWSKSRLRDISDPTAQESDSLEGQHNGVHNWIDGQMNILALAPYEPVFLLHHSFVDLIWEIFRTRQLERGINPAFDFVPTNMTGQNPNEEAYGIDGYVNRDGYSNRIADLVWYGPIPSCPYCGFSIDMYCDVRKGLCVSREQPSGTYKGDPVLARKIGHANGLAEGRYGRTYHFRRRDERVRGDSVTLPRMKMKIVWVEAKRKTK